MLSVEIAFYEDLVEVIHDELHGVIYIVCKRVCQNLGLDWPGQFRHLQGHGVLSKYLIYGLTSTDLGMREMVCLPLKYLPLWLAGIQNSRVRLDLQAKLLRYQEECADVLAQHFLHEEKPVRNMFDILQQNLADQVQMVRKLQQHDLTLHDHSEQLPLIVKRVEDLESFAMDLQTWRMQEEVKRQQDALDKKKREDHAKREFPDWVKEWIWEEARGRCMQCNIKLDPTSPRKAHNHPHYDHIRPKNRGGLGTVDNCQLLCARCNARKGSWLVDDVRPDDIKLKAQALMADKRRQTQLDEDQKHRQLRFLLDDIPPKHTPPTD